MLDNWTIETARLSQKATVSFEATDEERQALVEALGVSGVGSFTFKGTVRGLRRDRFHVEGVVRAEIVQACVVTLEPIESVVSEDISQQYWPEGTLPTPGPEEEVDPFVAAPPEPIVSGKLVLGQLAYELISAQIDPYPRKDGEEIGQMEAGGGTPEEHPFAALKDLQDR